MRAQQDTMLAPPEFKAVHPLGKSPLITDGDAVAAEFSLIIGYLVKNMATAN